MKIASKLKKAEPIFTVEERSSKTNKTEIKGIGY